MPLTGRAPLRRPTGPVRPLRLQTKPRTAKPTTTPIRNLCHKCGLKHVFLLTVLFFYHILGAVVFFYCEHSKAEASAKERSIGLRRNRTTLVNNMLSKMFNNSEFLFFLTQEQSRDVAADLDKTIRDYEVALGVQLSKRRWDFWDAMLYAQMVSTTIGGGSVDLYPTTFYGRVFTMVYVLIGIPLVLTILDDLGKILTRCLIVPWWLLKCGCRRSFRYCTRQTIDEIRRLDQEDREELHSGELPVLVAVLVVLGWMCVCSASLCMWERDWHFFDAFYFFFISLSTIGLGDRAPSQPYSLLVMFVYIVIGLALISVCINLIQGKMGALCQSDRQDKLSSVTSGSLLGRSRSSLGLIRTSAGSSSYSAPRQAIPNCANQQVNKCCQTILSFPLPSKNNVVTQSILNSKVCPRSLSIDDVMKLVDTEEGDIILLTELTRDQSTFSELSDAIRSDVTDPSQQVVVSKSFESNFDPPPSPPALLSVAIPRHSAQSRPSNCPSATPMLPQNLDIETLEEIEDRFLLSRAASFDANPSVHFRSRLSLIMEQQSTVEDESSAEPSMSSTKSSLSSPADEHLGNQ